MPVIETCKALPRPWLERFLAGTRQDMPLYIALGVYILLAWLAASQAGVADRFSVLVYPKTTVTISVAFAGGFWAIYSAYVALIIKPPQLLKHIFGHSRAWLTSPDVWRGLPLLVVFTLFFSAVSSFKTLIPAFQPFSWDARLIAWDKWLHAGEHPWVWLQGLMGYPLVTFVTNFFYNLWLLAMFAVFYWQLFATRKPVLRNRFLMAFIVCWAFNGSLLAVLFSSAGPCFFGRLYPEMADPFAPLMAYLEGVNEILPVWALSTQDTLWELYRSDSLGVGAGISAMPSMHISVAWLMVLVTRHSERWLAVLTAIFFVMILLGSVHLAWHYAVDGYLSIVTTTLIWWLLGKVYRHRTPAQA